MVDRELTPRRRLLLDSAVTVVAEQGLRGLTHRAVDREAALAEGSCSAYLRTRSALLAALSAYVVDQLAGDVERLAADVVDCEEGLAIERTAELFLGWLDREQLLRARLELTIEATRVPEIADVVLASRHRLEGLVVGLLDRRDTPDARRRGVAMVSAADGILLAALLLPRADRRAFVTESLPLVMHGLGPHFPSAGPASG